MKFHSDNIRLVLLSLFASALALTCSAQGWMDDEEDMGPRRRGIEFGLNMGVYQPFSAKPDYDNVFKDNAANFYNGAAEFDLGDNTAGLNSIANRAYDIWTSNQIISLLQNAGYTVDQGLNEANTPVWCYDLMTYETSMLFGLRIAGFFSPESAIVMSADFASLKAVGQYQIEFTNLPATNQIDRYYDSAVFGEERRFIGTLGYRTSLYINSVSSFLFEFGGVATGTQVMRNYFVVEGQPFQLIYLNTGPGQFNGQSSNLSNIGFGGYAAIGLEGLFEEGGNLEANLRVSYDRIKLGSQELDEFDEVRGYSQMQWNFGLYVTWMIPPHIGDFVRASF